MKSYRWTGLLQNQVVAIVLALLVVVPMLFAASPDARTDQMTAYGLLGLLLLVVWLFRTRDEISLAKARTFLFGGPNLPIVLYFAWGLASVLGSTERDFSQLSFIQLACGVVLYAMVVYQFRHRDQIRALLHGLIVVGVLMVVTALYLAQDRLFPLAGTFHDRQLFGGFLALVLPVLMGIAAGTRSRRWKLSAQISCVLVAGALICTQCRSAWIGFGVALIVFIALGMGFVWKISGFLRKKHELLVTPILALIILGIFIGFTRMGGPTVRRLTTFSAIQQDESVKDRVGLWRVAVDVIRAKPLVGHGIGTYTLVQSEFNPDSRSREVIRQMGPTLSESPHNTYLQIAGEQGLIGLALYLAILVLFCYRALIALPRMEKGLRQYTLIGCISAVVGQSVDAIANPAWTYPECTAFFWLVLGVGMAAAGLSQEMRSETTARVEAADAPVFGIPRFLYRGVRTAMILCGAIWLGAHLLNLNTAVAASAGEVSANRARPSYRPIYCDHITKLGLDFRNDSVQIPTAWNVTAGATSYDRLAAFHVYALTDDPRFWANVTVERRHTRWKRIGLKGKFYYAETSGDPRWFYKPHLKDRGRTGTLLVTYNCTAPRVRYQTKFILTVLPNRAPIDTFGREGRSPDAVGSFDPFNPLNPLFLNQLSPLIEVSSEYEEGTEE